MAGRPGRRAQGTVSQVVWLPEALEDIERLHAFLADKNPQAARNAMLCIQAAGRQLESFPEIGRPMRKDRRWRSESGMRANGAIFKTVLASAKSIN